MKVGSAIFGEVIETYGIREGSMSSPSQANIYTNILKSNIDSSELGIKVNEINCTHTGVADDAITATTSFESTIAIQNQVFNMSRIAFIKQNESKANCLIISPFKDYDTNLYNRLNVNRKNKINLVESADYLGCTLTAEDISFTNVKLRIEIAKQKLDSLLYNGFVGTRIMPTEVRMTQIRMYVDTSALTNLDAFYIDSRSELLLKNCLGLQSQRVGKRTT